jgi:hypothetical protein
MFIELYRKDRMFKNFLTNIILEKLHSGAALNSGDM